MLADDPGLAALVAARPGLRVPGAWNGFELAVRVILGQQVSVAAGSRLAGKLVAQFGTPVETTIPGLTALFPAPARLVADAEVLSLHLNMPRARAAAIVNLARAAQRRPICWSAARDSKPRAPSLRRDGDRPLDRAVHRAVRPA